MKRLRKILAASFIWATAASTLLAGVPYSVCACAGYTPRKFSTPAPEELGCCCSKATPAVSSAAESPAVNKKPGKTKVCCTQPSEEPSDQPDAVSKEVTNQSPPGPQLDSSRCQKQLVQTQIASTVGHTTKASESADLESHLPVLSELSWQAPNADITVGCRAPRPEPPNPRNLLTLLSRLTI